VKIKGEKFLKRHDENCKSIYVLGNDPCCNAYKTIFFQRYHHFASSTKEVSRVTKGTKIQKDKNYVGRLLHWMELRRRPSGLASRKMNLLSRQ
jgi:hypothetical protein